MREPPVKKTLFWCDQCNIPLIGRTCTCGFEARPLQLLEPYDIRPALAADMDLIRCLLEERFGSVPVPRVLLLNKAGGLDRNDLVIANGKRFGWLSFDPAGKKFRFDLSPEALPFILPHATRGVLDLEYVAEMAGNRDTRGRIGGKKFKVTTGEPDGTVIVKYRGRYGTAVLNDGWLRVKEVMPVTAVTCKDPTWDEVVEKNRYHLKNLERNAIRAIRQHIKDRPAVNVSFSGGKDSTAVFILAKKAGVKDAFFIDTGIEFPETVEFVRSMDVEIVSMAGDFWAAVERAGPPAKDNRWCCKLLKQNPLRILLAKTGPCVTIQGNRWYESWNRADLELSVQNPLNPLQLNISPIRNWRALEVFLYLWWQNAPINPLYDEGVERIGCYPCPSMLESEFSVLSRLHPDLASRWSDVLSRWAHRKGLPEEYVKFGLWRWKGLPNKMQELCRQHHIALKETPDGVVVKPVPGEHRIHRETEPVPAGVSTSVCHGIPTTDSKKNYNRQPNTTQMLPTYPHPAGRDETEPGIKISRPPGSEDEPDPFMRLRNDFHLLSELTYLDSASMSLSPEPVLRAVLEYERSYRALVHGEGHRLGGIAAQRYWHAHEKVARLIGGEHGVTVFVKSLAEAMEIVMKGISWHTGDRVLVTAPEQPSNLNLLRRSLTKGIGLEIVPLGKDYVPDLGRLGEIISEGGVRIVFIPQISDVFGSIAPLEEIVQLCKAGRACLLVDGSHAVPHIPVDVSRIGADFFYYSGHTTLAPTGTGVLWIRNPGVFTGKVPGKNKRSAGGENVDPRRAYEFFEPGIPHISGGIGLGAAADYLRKAGMEQIGLHDKNLTTRLISGLLGVKGVKVFAPENTERCIGIVSFTIDGIHPRDVIRYLDEEADILVSTGLPDPGPQLINVPGIENGTIRASICMFNNETDIDMLIASVGEIARGI
jgi:cysteine desulfurase / selenocysteine lyase